ARNTTACSAARRSGSTPSSAGMAGNTAAPSGTSSGAGSLSLISTPGHRRDDRQLVAVLDRRGEVVQVADVLVVLVDVDEAPHGGPVEDAGGDARELRPHVVEDRFHRI